MTSNTTKVVLAIIVVGCIVALAAYTGLTEEHRSFMDACVSGEIGYGKGEEAARYHCELLYQRTS
jgi:hypothetical protein